MPLRFLTIALLVFSWIPILRYWELVEFENWHFYREYGAALLLYSVCSAPFSVGALVITLIWLRKQQVFCTLLSILALLQIYFAVSSFRELSILMQSNPLILQERHYLDVWMNNSGVFWLAAAILCLCFFFEYRSYPKQNR